MGTILIGVDRAIRRGRHPRERLILLDIGHGDAVGIEIFGVDPARWDEYVSGAMPIVESFVFAEP